MSRMCLLVCVLFFSNTVYRVNIEGIEPKIKKILTKAQINNRYPGVSMAIAYDGKVYADQVGYSDYCATAAY